MTSQLTRSQLVDQYAQYKRDLKVSANNPYYRPNVLEEAGYWLGYPAPLHAFDGNITWERVGYWARVRGIIADVMGETGGAV